MSSQVNTVFAEYVDSCPETEKEKIQKFFDAFSMHCLLSKKEKSSMQADFERAILYYLNHGVSLDKALQLLDVKYLGGFYARPPVEWFSLDDAAKIYPLSMKHGRMTLYRLAVNLKEPVVPELLQMALNFTIKRFPSFATTLKKGFFWHYLDTSKSRFFVEEERDIPCQPLKVSQSGAPAFRILYYEKRISIEIFHMLADGTGGMTFLKVLLAEYIRLTGEYVTSEDLTVDGNIWDINAIPTWEEFENAFEKVPKVNVSGGFMDKSAVQMSGRLTDNRPCRLLHFKMKASSLKAVAKSYNTTVTTYLLALMFLSAKAATDQLQGEMSFQLPVNMRKFYPTKTVRNFSMYCGIRLNISQITDVEHIIEKISGQIKEKTAKEPMSAMANSATQLVKVLKWIPLAVKQPVAKAIYGFLGDGIFTSNFSNLGVVPLPPAVAKHVECFDSVLGASIINRLTCCMVTVNDIANLTISKMTVDPSFEEKLYDLLLADGVELTVEGSEVYGR